MASRTTSEDLGMHAAICSPTLQTELPGIFPMLPTEPVLEEDWWPLAAPEAEQDSTTSLYPTAMQAATLTPAGSPAPSLADSQPVVDHQQQLHGSQSEAALSEPSSRAGHEQLQALLESQPEGQGHASDLPDHLHEPGESASETEVSDSDSDLALPGATFCTNCTSRIRDDFCEARRLPNAGVLPLS